MDQTTWKNCLEEKHEIDWLNLVVLITLQLHCQVGLCLYIKTKNIVDNKNRNMIHLFCVIFQRFVLLVISGLQEAILLFIDQKQ